MALRAKQLVTLNPSITEKAGWCLSYARRFFGAPAVESTAWEAWSRVENRHEDRSFPEGVAVPVWFDWWGQLPGDTQRHQYGHAAVRTADGRIWSSPLSGTGNAIFNSVDDLTKAFGGGMKYVGWSKDISGVKVISLEIEMEQMTDQDTINLITPMWGDGHPNSVDLAGFRGNSFKEGWYKAVTAYPFVNLMAWLKQAERRKNELEVLIPELQKKLTEFPQDTSEAELKLRAIKDALGIK